MRSLEEITKSNSLLKASLSARGNIFFTTSKRDEAVISTIGEWPVCRRSSGASEDVGRGDLFPFIRFELGVKCGDDDVEVDEEGDGNGADGLDLPLLEFIHVETGDQCDGDTDDLEYVKG